MLLFEAKKTFHSNATGLDFKVKVTIITHNDEENPLRTDMAKITGVSKQDIMCIDADDIFEYLRAGTNIDLGGVAANGPDIAKEVFEFIEKHRKLKHGKIFSFEASVQEITQEQESFLLSLNKHIHDDGTGEVYSFLVTTSVKDLSQKKATMKLAEIMECSEDEISYTKEHQTLFADNSSLHSHDEDDEEFYSAPMVEKIKNCILEIDEFFEVTVTPIE